MGNRRNMRLVRIFGVDFRLNIFFLLLFLLYYYFGIILQALIVFSAVLVHEIGHIMVALGYGIKVREIELLPFGGVAKLEGNIELDPLIEIYVAVAGPITSGFLVLLGLVMEKTGIGNQQWLPFFIRCNLMLLAFNLVPAFPLDGGRVFRAITSFRFGLKKATDNAVRLSQAISIVLAVAGIYSIFLTHGKDINLLIIAIFLLYCALKEKGSAMYIFMKFLTKKKEELLKEGVLLTRQVIALDTSFLRDVVKFFVPKKYHIVSVVDKKHSILGTFTEGEIIEGLLHYGPDARVGFLIQKHN